MYSPESPLTWPVPDHPDSFRAAAEDPATLSPGAPRWRFFYPVLSCMAYTMQTCPRDYIRPISDQNRNHPLRQSVYAKHFFSHMRNDRRYYDLTDDHLWELFLSLLTPDYIDILDRLDNDLEANKPLRDPPPEMPDFPDWLIEAKITDFFPVPTPRGPTDFEHEHAKKLFEKSLDKPNGAPWPTAKLFADQRGQCHLSYPPYEMGKYLRQAYYWKAFPRTESQEEPVGPTGDSPDGDTKNGDKKNPSRMILARLPREGRIVSWTWGGDCMCERCIEADQ